MPRCALTVTLTAGADIALLTPLCSTLYLGARLKLGKWAVALGHLVNARLLLCKDCWGEKQYKISKHKMVLTPPPLPHLRYGNIPQLDSREAM